MQIKLGPQHLSHDLNQDNLGLKNLLYAPNNDSTYIGRENGDIDTMELHNCRS